MSDRKKQIRAAFRDRTFKRDKYSCVMCGTKADPKNPEEILDAHHVIDRNLMPGGGYVMENGISLCSKCHELAEIFHSTGVAHPGFSPEDLYKKIDSSYDLAYKASQRLVLK